MLSCVLEKPLVTSRFMPNKSFPKPLLIPGVPEEYNWLILYRLLLKICCSLPCTQNVFEKLNFHGCSS